MPERAEAPRQDHPVARTQFATTDPDEARLFLERVYSARVADTAEFDRHAPVSLAHVEVDEFSSVDLTLPRDLALRLEGTEDLSVTTVIRGTSQVQRGKDLERFGTGDTWLGAFPGGEFTVRCRRLVVEAVTVSGRALARAAGESSDRRPDPLRFPSLAPVSPAAGEQWKRAAAFGRQVLADDATLTSPLVLGSTARLLAAAALAAFRRDPPDDEPRRADAAAPDTLRRAEEFIHAHAGSDIDLTAIAAACHVTPRALQHAFAHHRDTTPMRYLRRVRLARAHQDLLDADPASGATVTAVAAGWGFAHPGRFAAEYRRDYGRAPSTTLHQW